MIKTDHPLAKAMRALNWTQQELAHQANLSASQISRAVHYKVGFNPSTAAKVAKIINAAGVTNLRLEHLLFPLEHKGFRADLHQ